MKLPQFSAVNLIAIFSMTIAITSCSVLPEQPSPIVEFIAVGDMPYSDKENDMLTAPNGDIVKAVKDLDPAVLLHFGDLKAGGASCTNDLLMERQQQLAQLHPNKVMYAPGDNDWTDCDRRSLFDRFDELERLDFLRTHYFSGEGDKLTRGLTGLVRQSDFIENAKWSKDGLVFGTLNIPGTNNGRVGIERGNADDILNEADRRDNMNKLWIDQLFADTKSANGLVITFQADIYQPSIKRFPVECTANNRSKCDGYMKTRQYIEQQSRLLNKPVLIIHGDTSAYCFHQPIEKTTKNLWRLNGLGDYRISDAAQITFNPNNTDTPFKVVSLLGQQALPKVCKYRD